MPRAGRNRRRKTIILDNNVYSMARYLNDCCPECKHHAPGMDKCPKCGAYITAVRTSSL